MGDDPRPKKPRKNAGESNWEKYWSELRAWQLRNRGSTMYERNLRGDTQPAGARGHVNLRGEEGVEGHSTQYYADGYRHSCDGDGKGDKDEHWTNQNYGRLNDHRHEPPPDAYR